MAQDNFSAGRNAANTPVHSNSTRGYDLSYLLSDETKASIRDIFSWSTLEFAIDDGKGLVFQWKQSSWEVHEFNPVQSVQKNVLDILATLANNYRITISFTENPDGDKNQATTRTEFDDFVEEFVSEWQWANTQFFEQLFNDEKGFQDHLKKEINARQRPSTSTK